MEYIKNNKEWILENKKSGGARDAGEIGGVYYNKDKNLRALIKKDKNVNFNIAEYLGAKIFGEIAPNSGANVELMKVNKEDIEAGDGSNIYVRSEFFDNYNDMYVDAEKNLKSKDLPLNFLKKDGRPIMMGTQNKLFNSIDKMFNKLQYQDFDKIAPTSLLIGDFDMHVGNIGVVRNKNQDPKLVRIDYGWAFSKLEPDIHPHSRSKHLPGMCPTNHFREFPRSLKLNHNFVDQLKKASSKDLNNVIDNCFEELKSCYDHKTLFNWAKHSMPQKYKNMDIKNTNIDKITKDFKEIMISRQASLKEFALEIEMGLMLNKNKDNKFIINDHTKFKKMIQDNADYFIQIAEDKKPIHLRDKNIAKSNNAKNNLKNAIIKNLKELGHTIKTPKKENYSTPIQKFCKKFINVISQLNVIFRKQKKYDVSKVKNFVVETDNIIQEAMKLDIDKSNAISNFMNLSKESLKRTTLPIEADFARKNLLDASNANLSHTNTINILSQRMDNITPKLNNILESNSTVSKNDINKTNRNHDRINDKDRYNKHKKL